MNTQLLMDTAKAMVADDKGVLAMDESHTVLQRGSEISDQNEADSPVFPTTMHMRRTVQITTLLLDIGGVLLNNGQVIRGIRHTAS